MTSGLYEIAYRPLEMIGGGVANRDARSVALGFAQFRGYIMNAKQTLRMTALAFRQGDAVWEDIVRWSLNVMIEAEEYGITSSNADSMKTSENPAIKRLVGSEGELGAAFGLDNEWSLRIIKQVGNYGESYKRNIADPGILPDRGPNQLWTKGGILYVPPAR